MKCGNCKKEIMKEENGCYSKEACKWFCSLDCFTDFAHEYLRCVTIQTELDYIEQLICGANKK